MKYNLFALLILLISCEPNYLVDLTPDDGFNTDFAFNVPQLNRAISNETTVQDTGWYVVDTASINVISPFVDSVRYISTDTFAFEWEDYKPVMRQIHRIANGFDITNSVTKKDYRWLNRSMMYSNADSYLIPLFNKDGQRYWLEVFREKVNWFSYYYTARGIWAISKPHKIKGDVS